ncbi:hypothetical protein GTO27_03990 [Candidatus Bathyarchaeota archaeon]|nr:hypothetical protein [Candidatus Bathyarchaeota archaeon]
MQNFIFEAAKKLDTAEPTVRHRVEILRKQGITTVSVDSCKIGLRITAMALMKTDAEHFKNLPRSC